jgi:hypothetical protein
MSYCSFAAVCFQIESSVCIPGMAAKCNKLAFSGNHFLPGFRLEAVTLFQATFGVDSQGWLDCTGERFSFISRQS